MAGCVDEASGEKKEEEDETEECLLDTCFEAATDGEVNVGTVGDRTFLEGLDVPDRVCESGCVVERGVSPLRGAD